MWSNEKILKQLKGGLVVSCQALEEEPLYAANIMDDMANAAKQGGAVGIRANSVRDIKKIKNKVDLPVIGIIKAKYANSDVYITPTMLEVEQLIACGCEVIAIDGTKRKRPDGSSLEEFFSKVREKYPNQLFMADCSDVAEGLNAVKIGFDLIGTTLCGYTEYTKGIELPNYKLIKDLSCQIDKPIVAEGGIWEREQLVKVFKSGACTAVVGTAITRPRDITRRFVEAIEKSKNMEEKK